ncbi:transmembrane serine protease filzig isoform X1 [Rhynchophorus ferrugineus]|uniref:transmembrane serine protease filzig isoform X1 n=1 Tax=Rhynchophorus ferrugineus TaxID=354439 RepID=UPI003FCD8B63
MAAHGSFVLIGIITCIVVSTALDVGNARSDRSMREGRKLFGGYRISPKHCKPTKTSASVSNGQTICMFNDECSTRKGEVVGACMDGFLFGACCQLPKETMVGAYLDQALPIVTSIDNSLTSRLPTSTHRTTLGYGDIPSNSVSQIAASLLGDNNPPFSGNGNDAVLPTGDDNVVVEVGGKPNWSTTGVTHSQLADTIIDNDDNEIKPSYFSPTRKPINKLSTLYPEQTTTRYADTYPPPILQISVSNAPLGYTPLPTLQKPMFRPKPTKPTDGNYILVPTITHETNPTKTKDEEVFVKIANQTSTTGEPLMTFSYVTSSQKPPATSRKPPSTSYVFSTTLPPRRTQPTKSTKPSKKPVKTTVINKVAATTSKVPSTSYIYSSSFDASSLKPTKAPKPPSTSYVYSSTFRPSPSTQSTWASSSPNIYQSSSTNKPPSTISSSVAGPSFTVTSQTLGQYSPYPNPAPTLIVLGPGNQADDSLVVESSSTTPRPTTTTSRPIKISALPQRKPINHVTINNHVTQNIYSSERPQTSSISGQNAVPSPTVIITPKPVISSTYASTASTTDSDADSIVVTSVNDMINFPPDRNPNITYPGLSDADITTPAFVEDDTMKEKLESFVNQIIYGLQGPFNDLKDVIDVKNTTQAPTTTTKKPPRVTTKKPVVRPNTLKTTTKKPATTKRPVTLTVTTKRTTTTTTKRPATTKKTQTTTESLIETVTDFDGSYRDVCGVRPLVRAGRIVGGKGATFGEFPWQVLVRESTWLGLFTKNKCGGVLINEKYVMTAAHCQPAIFASLVAVFGEFDISGDLESKKPVSKNVKRVIVHRKYDPDTFENDLALLELESPVKFDSHIIPICLPRDNEDFTGRMATVTGWGRLRYGGAVPSVLQEVQVPIMENNICQDMYRTAGHSKVILDSFLCAGYTTGEKDSCEGDSGGPLVLQRPDGRYELAGTVSHGIKCAAPYLPGVYMRTTYYKPWITSITGIQ